MDTSLCMKCITVEIESGSEKEQGMKKINSKDSEMKKWRRNGNKLFAFMRNAEEEQVIRRDCFRRSGERKFSISIFRGNEHRKREKNTNIKEPCFVSEPQ